MYIFVFIQQSVITSINDRTENKVKLFENGDKLLHEMAVSLRTLDGIKEQ